MVGDGGTRSKQHKNKSRGTPCDARDSIYLFIYMRRVEERDLQARARLSHVSNLGSPITHLESPSSQLAWAPRATIATSRALRIIIFVQRVN